jgi:hypothetical protein
MVLSMSKMSFIRLAMVVFIFDLFLQASYL